MTCRTLLTYSIEVQDTLLRLQSGLELRPVIVMRSVSLSRSVPVPLPIPPLGDVPSAPVGAESQAPELAPVRDVTPPPENWGYVIPNLTKLRSKPRKRNNKKKQLLQQQEDHSSDLPASFLDLPEYPICSFRRAGRAKTPDPAGGDLPTMVVPRRLRLERERAQKQEAEAAAVKQIEPTTSHNQVSTTRSSTSTTKTVIVSAPTPISNIRATTATTSTKVTSKSTPLEDKTTTRSQTSLFPREKLETILVKNQADKLDDAMRQIAQHPHGTTLVPLKCQPNPPNQLTTPLLTTEPDRQTYAGVNTHLQKIVDALADQDSLVPMPQTSRDLLDSAKFARVDPALVCKPLKLPEHVKEDQPCYITHKELSDIDQALNFANAALHTSKELQKYQLNCQENCRPYTANALLAANYAKNRTDVGINAVQAARAYGIAIRRRSLIDTRCPKEQQHKLIGQQVTDTTKLLN